jgi:hypothetical protein
MVEDSADYIFFRLRLVRKMKYFGCHFDMSEDVEKDFRIFKKKKIEPVRKLRDTCWLL